MYEKMSIQYTVRASNPQPNVSLFPKPLDQGSCPGLVFLCFKN